MLAASKASNFTLYKITFKNSPMFHVTWKGSGSNGLTVWGMKIITPFSARNSDGIDPDGSNITITNSSISDGDDNIAISASSVASNITISNDNTYSGHGISVGSITMGGLSNMLVTNINQAGTAIDGNGIALRLKATPSNGGRAAERYVSEHLHAEPSDADLNYAALQLKHWYVDSAVLKHHV